MGFEIPSLRKERERLGHPPFANNAKGWATRRDREELQSDNKGIEKMNTQIVRFVLLGGALFVGDHQAFSQTTHIESPRYPDLARQTRIEGTVQIGARVNAMGGVDSVEAVGRHQWLREEAERNARKWIFASGKVESVEIWYEFKLQKPDVRYRPEARVTVDLPILPTSAPVKVLVVSQAPEGIRDNVVLKPKP